MKEIIDEIAGQAFEYASEHADESGKGSLGVFADKFAELLVELCAKQCNPEPGLKYSPNSLSARLDCKNKILELL